MAAVHAPYMRRCIAALLLVATAMLGGCGLPRMIDSDVQSFVSGDGALTGVGYRFERLPSQQARTGPQDTLEHMAEVALTEAGLHRDDLAPRYSAQVTLSVQTMAPPVQRRPRTERPVVRPDGTVLYPPPTLSILLEPPWYNHSVHLVLRDLRTAQVAFESTASFDGPWSDSNHLVPVILRAALRDYPHPPEGVRKVVIELPAPATADE
jgi:hypothetical protein